MFSQSPKTGDSDGGSKDTTVEDASQQQQQPQQQENSPIIWLGKFMFNGLPTKIFDFKSPFSPMYWFDSLKDMTSRSTANLSNDIMGRVGRFLSVKRR